MSRTQQLLDDPRQFRRSVIIVLSIAFVARFAVLAAFWPSWDWHNKIVPDQWNELAINLAEHRTFAFSDLPTSPTVMRGPLFPFFEVPLYLIFGENYVGWVITLLLLDLFSCFLLVVTVRNLWGQRASLFAGLLYAVSLALIYYTCKIMQVTSIIPFVVTWLYLITVWERNYFSRWVPLAIGVVSGLMILNKTVYLPVPPVAAIVLLWLNRSKVRQLTHIAPVALYLVTTFLVVAPWTYRNYIVTSGHVVPVQSMFWELFVQDVLYDDLDATVGHDRPDGQLLDYWMEKENAMVVAAGLSVTPPADARARWEMQREASFRVAGLEMLKNDPMKVLRVKLANLWQFWVLAENWEKTRLFILLQVVPLGAAMMGFLVLCRYRQLNRIKFSLLLVAILWGEHCLVWGWGRLSLDLMPALAVIFGLGMDALTSHVPPEAELRPTLVPN